MLEKLIEEEAERYADNQNDCWSNDHDSFIAGANFIKSKLFTEEEVKFIATRFRHQCSLKGINTNNDTINLFDSWFKEFIK